MLIPVGHEENTVTRWPWVTLGIIGLCVIVDLLDVPRAAWALVPAEFSLLKVLTSMFVHEDGWHLGFNLLFLYLVGPFIEDRWGRPYFAGFYLLSGLAGALTQTLLFPDSMVGSIGASGAIAGVMGAFAVRYREAKIRFLYFFGPGFTGLAGTFLAPAWLMLGLWAMREISVGLVVLSGLGWTGVAHWVHVGGFLFGFATAAGIAALELEERYLRKKIHSAVAVFDNPAVEKAHEARERNRHDLAWGLLEDELHHHPGNREAAILSWDLGVELGKPQRALRPMLRCIQDELREGENELALVHWDEVRTQLPAARLGLFLRVRLAELLHAQGRDAEVAKLLAGAAEEAAGQPPVLMLRLARLVAEVDTTAAREIIGIALADPACLPELREELEAVRCRVVEKQHQAELEARRYRRLALDRPPFVLTKAGLPASGAAWKRTEESGRRYLLAEVEDEGRMILSPERIHAVGTARIEGRLRPPYLIVDLFLDPFLPTASRVRVLRFTASLFDPSAAEFDPLVRQVVEASGCRRFPRQALGSFLSYGTKTEYEEAVLAEMSGVSVVVDDQRTATSTLNLGDSFRDQGRCNASSSSTRSPAATESGRRWLS